LRGLISHFSIIISPLRLSESPVEPGRSPLYGEHTADVLRRFAGYTSDEIEAPHNKGVIVHT
jgi:crotonobetainyl-CoA:carnitine CoA-transferase CaiB-like acyl-CoA transferase